MKKLALLLTMLLVLGFGTAAHAAMSIEIDFYGGTTSYEQGVYDTGGTINLLPGQDSVMVDIVALDVPMDNGVSIFGWKLDFNGDNMTISNLTNGPGFSQTFPGSGIFENYVQLNAATFNPVDGDAVLATFMLTCTNASLDDLFLNALEGQNFLADGTGFDNQYPGLIASVNQVPIPGAAWLLGSGLFGLVAIRRKKK